MYPASKYRCSVFGDLVPEERERIIHDNNMYPFCLRQGADQDCFGRGTDRKPACPVPEWARK
jgi:hypothetical protein